MNYIQYAQLYNNIRNTYDPNAVKVRNGNSGWAIQFSIDYTPYSDLMIGPDITHRMDFFLYCDSQYSNYELYSARNKYPFPKEFWHFNGLSDAVGHIGFAITAEKANIDEQHEN